MISNLEQKLSRNKVQSEMVKGVGGDRVWCIWGAVSGSVRP